MPRVLVVGGGPGGYTAAETAADMGAEVTLFERERLGGTCGTWGCIPTKTLFTAAAGLHDAARMGRTGVITEPKLDFPVVKAHMRKVVERTEKGVEFLLKRAGVTIVKGEATVDMGERSVSCNGETYRGDALILATGTTEGRPGVFDVPGVWTSKDLLMSDSVPDSMVVVGAGAVGVEFTSIYNVFGTRIVLVEALERILPLEDSEVSKTLHRILKKRGVDIRTGSGVARVLPGGSGVELENGSVIETERVLLAVGRRVLSDYDLEKEGQFIKVNQRMETSVKGVYAVGDVTGGKMLAHKAHAEGVVAGTNAAGGSMGRYWKVVPSVTFSIPEVASVGVSEEEGAVTGKFLYRALGKGLAEGQTEGFCKVVADKEGILVGCHILGHNASELIQEAVMAVENGMTVSQVARAVHAHPTMPELIQEACRDCVTKLR